MNEHIDIEVKRMSKESIEMLNNLSAVCKRYGINYIVRRRKCGISWIRLHCMNTNCKRRVNKA